MLLLTKLIPIVGSYSFEKSSLPYINDDLVTKTLTTIVLKKEDFPPHSGPTNTI